MADSTVAIFVPNLIFKIQKAQAAALRAIGPHVG
jgi:hypothetical protein